MQEFTGLSRNTIMAWIRAEKIPAYQVGDTVTAPWYIPADVVEQVRQARIAELQRQIEEINRPVPLNGSHE